MEKEELKEILEKHKKWFNKEEGGERANLLGANLTGANLSYANLEGANLEGANLRGANLKGANLKGANLEGSYLRGADLEGSYLRGANLENSNLEYAYLEGANLNESSLIGANLDYASWSLSCKTKNVKLCKKLQAQLLAHAFKVSPDCRPTEEQMDFIKENFHRFEEFWGDDKNE